MMSNTEERNWCVYRHTFPDGKVYIGKTQNDPYERWGHNGRGYQGQNKVFNAILEFGWANIKHEVMLDGLTDKEASTKEMELIKESSRDGQCGNYNVVFSTCERPQKPRQMTEDDEVINETTLHRHGSFILHMPDAFYDRFINKHGVAPTGIRFEDHGFRFEIWQSKDAGFEFSEIVTPYPRDGMTYREAKQWLIDSYDGGEIDHKSFFTKEQIDNALKELKSAI